MTDTNHIEQRARELLAAECNRTVEGMRYDAYGVVPLNVALSAISRALSARASAGEGGVDYRADFPCPAVWTWQEKEYSGEWVWRCGFNRRELQDRENRIRNERQLTAAPQPAQAGASGGGEAAGYFILNDQNEVVGYSLPQLKDDVTLREWERMVPVYYAPASHEPELRWTCQGKIFGRPTATDALEYANANWTADSAQDTRVERCERIRAVYATPQPESASGEWVMVPREPTPEMCEAFHGISLSMDDLLFQDRVLSGREPGITEKDQCLPAIRLRTFSKGYAAMLAAAPHPQQATAQADDAAEQYRQAHNAGEAHGRVMAALEAATPPAHGDGEGVRSLIERKLRKLPKHWRSHIGPGAATREIKRADGDTDYCNDNRIWAETAIAIENFLYDYDELTARPAPEADARDGEVLAKWIVRHRNDFPSWITVDHACAKCVPDGEMVKSGFVCAYHVAERIAAMSLPAQGREGE